jgi:hypothetical protein
MSLFLQTTTIMVQNQELFERTSSFSERDQALQLVALAPSTMMIQKFPMVVNFSNIHNKLQFLQNIICLLPRASRKTFNDWRDS